MNKSIKRKSWVLVGGLGIISERFDDARNLVRHAVKRSNDWKAFYGIATVAEQYLRGDANIHLHLSLNPHSSLHDVKDWNTIGREFTNMSDYCIWMNVHPTLYGGLAKHPCKLNATYGDSQNRNQVVLVTEDLDAVQQRVAITADRSSI